MKLTADYHTHTVFSDGKGRALDNARAAERAGLEEIAITEHGYSHYFRGLHRRETEKWLAMVREADEGSSVRVLRGMECNIRGVSGLSDFTPEDYENFDIFLAGIHIVIHYEKFSDTKLGWGGWLRKSLGISPSDSLIRETTKAYVNAVMKNPIDAVTHLNFQCFADPTEVAKACRDYGTYVELNSKKMHLSDEELARVNETGVRYIINSDAHSPERVGDLKLAAEQIARVGIDLRRIDNIDGRLPSFRYAAFKKTL